MHTAHFYSCLRKLPYLGFFVFTLLIFGSSVSQAQERKTIEILNSGYAESVEGHGTNAQRLVDDVYIRHEDVLMWCDTAYTYSGVNSNKVDAVGNVHIKQGDTLHLYANYVFYNGDIGFARAWDNVKLENKTTLLYSDTLDYDMDNNISYYDDYGKIIDSTTTITSKIGKYFLNEDMIFFYDEVEAINEDVTLKSDTVNYNTVTGKLDVEGPTTIQDSVNILYTEDGWYNSNTGEAELLTNPVIYAETQQLEADYIKYFKETGIGHAVGNVRMEDEDNKSIVTGHLANYNEATGKAVVSDSAVYMSYTETDTLWLHADTLQTVPDTLENERIITAYHGVRFYKTDIQGLCDSLVYYTMDSVIQLHQKPIIWSDIHQLSAEKIEMKQIANGPDELHLTKNSFIISEQDSNQFDQIKGKQMIGYIVNQELNKINVNGNGQTLYYAREEEGIIGLNNAESSKIEIRFKEGKIHQIVFIKSPLGELKPILELKAEDKKLKGFAWRIDERPISKDDIFEKVTVLEKENKAENKLEEIK